MSAGETIIGSEAVILIGHRIELSVCSECDVRVRIYDGAGRLLADIATTPARALNIAGLFKLAAERADPMLLVRQIVKPLQVVQ